MRTGQRELQSDLIKSTAILLVIVIHASAGPFYNYAFIKPTTWLVMDVYNSLARLAIPLFIMVSGALLLDTSKNEPLFSFLKNRFFRIGLPFFFWAAVYFMWRYFANHEVLTPAIILQDTLTGPYYHFWFIYIIGSLYLITPILRVFVNHAERRIVYYAAVLAIIGSSILPFLSLITGYSYYLDLSFPSGWAGYYLLGYLLKTEQLRTWKLFAGFIMGSVSMVVGTYFLTLGAAGQLGRFAVSVSQYFDWFAPIFVLTSALAYLLFRRINVSKIESHSGVSTVLHFIGAGTLTIYMVHPIILETLQRGYLGFTITDANLNAVVEVPLISAIAFAISIGVALGIRFSTRNLMTYGKSLANYNSRSKLLFTGDSKVGEQKVVKRSVAIALGIICVVLVASIVGTLAYYTVVVNDKNTNISNRDATISAMANQYNDYIASHHYNDDAYNLLQSIGSLGQQQTLLSQYTINQGSGTHTLVASFQAGYAGFLHIWLTSTTSNAYIIVEYWYQGNLFSFQKTIGTSGEAYFCILPTNVAIYAGNTNYVNGATDTITATYYY